MRDLSDNFPCYATLTKKVATFGTCSPHIGQNYVIPCLLLSPGIASQPLWAIHCYPSAADAGCVTLRGPGADHGRHEAETRRGPHRSSPGPARPSFIVDIAHRRPRRLGAGWPDPHWPANHVPGTGRISWWGGAGQSAGRQAAVVALLADEGEEGGWAGLGRRRCMAQRAVSLDLRRDANLLTIAQCLRARSAI